MTKCLLIRLNLDLFTSSLSNATVLYARSTKHQHCKLRTISNLETQNNTSLAQPKRCVSIASYYSASLQSNLHTAGLQAQFFKKSPFGHLQLQNGRHRNNLVAEIVNIALPAFLRLLIRPNIDGFCDFFSNLLVANWRLSPNFQSPNIFITPHVDQNSRSLERCTDCLPKNSTIQQDEQAIMLMAI